MRFLSSYFYQGSLRASRGTWREAFFLYRLPSGGSNAPHLSVCTDAPVKATQAKKKDSAMFCTQCGQEINDKAVICVKCGCAVTPQASRFVMTQSACSTVPQVTQPITPEVDSPDELPEKWMWALATVPITVSWILAGILAAVFENRDPSRLARITTVTTILLNIIFLSLDVKILKKTGRDIEKALWLGFILVPVYLFVRAAKYSKKYAPAIVWCVLFVLDILGGILADICTGGE